MNEEIKKCSYDGTIINVIKIVFTGLSLLSIAFLFYYFLSLDGPKIWAPYSLLTMFLIVATIPLQAGGPFKLILGMLGPIVLVLLFYLSVIKLLWRQSKVPFYPVIILGVFNVLYICITLPYGMRYPGEVYTITVSLISIISHLFLTIFVYRKRGIISFNITLFCYWLIFLWLITYGFPWLGLFCF